MEGYMASVISGVCALLFIGLGVPLANCRIPPNRWYGYRVSRYQFEDEEIWYAINARGGAHTVITGMVLAGYCGFTLLFAGERGAQEALTVVLTLMLLVWAAYEITWSVREARRMAREKGVMGKGGTDRA